MDANYVVRVLVGLWQPEKQGIRCSYRNVGNVGSVYLGIVRYSTKMPDARHCRDFRTFSLWFVFSEMFVVYEQSDTSLMQTSLLHWPKALTVT